MAPPIRQVDMTATENILAVALEARHSVDLLQSQVKQGMENVVTRLDSIGADQRDTAKSVRAVADQVSEMRSHSEGLERLGRAIDRNTAESLQWRKDHETANQAVSDRVTRFSGALWGFGLSVSIILGLSAYIVSGQFEAVRAARLASEASQAREIARLEARVEEIAKEAKATRGLK